VQHELSDLLREAAAGPPLRYTADDVLAAGRKRQRRRRALWTGVGSAAVVLAVAGVVTVPQVIAERPPRPAATGPATSDAVVYPAEAFTGNIPAYEVGRLSISGTVLVTPTYQSASVTVGSDVTGSVVVYRAGAFDASQVRSGTEVSIGGHIGYHTPGRTESTLAWEYAGDAWAVVSVRGAAMPSRQELEAVAAGLRSVPPQPMRVPFKLRYVPPGYALAATGVPAMRAGQAFVRLHRKGSTFAVTMYPVALSSAKTISTTPSCVPAGSCYRATEDRKWVAELTGNLPPAESAKVLERLVLADPVYRDTWYDAAEAVR